MPAPVTLPTEWFVPGRSDPAIPKFSELAPRLVEAPGALGSVYLIPEYTPISSQGPYGSCTANAWCDCLEILRGLEDPTTVEQLSRMFLWYVCRHATGDHKKNVGTMMQMVAWQLQHLGICSEKLWEYTDDHAYQSPTVECFKEANANQLTGFYLMTEEGNDRLDALEQSIRANHPVVFATDVGTDFKYGSKERVFDAPADVKGRHAMCWMGVARDSTGKRRWRTRNSWGTDWGDNGYAWMSDAYVTADITGDIFVGTRMPLLLV